MREGEGKALSGMRKRRVPLIRGKNWEKATPCRHSHKGVQACEKGKEPALADRTER